MPFSAKVTVRKSNPYRSTNRSQISRSFSISLAEACAAIAISRRFGQIVVAFRYFSKEERIHPEVDIHYRELAFPGSSTAQWLSDVDIAVCHLPPADENVWSTVLRVEPR